MSVPGKPAGTRRWPREGSGAVPWLLLAASHALTAGGVVAHPTEAVIGLAALAGDARACARVAALKGRGRAQRFLVIAADAGQLAGLVSLEVPLREEILASWPGPNTWIVPAAPGAPPWLQNRAAGIAVRVTGHAQAAALCRCTGPLISTSANPHGRPPARTLLAARRYFGAGVDVYLAGRLGSERRPSRIRDGLTGEVLRP